MISIYICTVYIHTCQINLTLTLQNSISNLTRTLMLSNAIWTKTHNHWLKHKMVFICWRFQKRQVGEELDMKEGQAIFQHYDVRVACITYSRLRRGCPPMNEDSELVSGHVSRGGGKTFPDNVIPGIEHVGTRQPDHNN